MSSAQHQEQRPGTSPEELADLRDGIEQTRAQLGETVEALAAKADVKARARDSVEMAKSRARDSAEAAKAWTRDSAEAARIMIKDNVRQTANATTEAARAFRSGPGSQMRSTAGSIGRSVREHPGPWAVAAGALALGLLVARRITARRWTP